MKTLKTKEITGDIIYPCIADSLSGSHTALFIDANNGLVLKARGDTEKTVSDKISTSNVALLYRNFRVVAL